MRSTFFVPAALCALAAFSCGNGKAPTPDASTDDGGGNDGPVTVFSYTPTGCNYSVTPTNDGLNTTAGAFVGLALDDTAAPSGDITPSLVRVGVGGGADATAPGYADPRTTAAFTWQTPTANERSEAEDRNERDIAHDDASRLLVDDAGRCWDERHVHARGPRVWAHAGHDVLLSSRRRTHGIGDVERRAIVRDGAFARDRSPSAFSATRATLSERRGNSFTNACSKRAPRFS